MSREKGHLDMERLDSVTILPPPDPGCSAGFNGKLSTKHLRPNYILSLPGGLPDDCPHLDCLVDAVHDL